MSLLVALALPGQALHAQDRGPAKPGEPTIQIELGGHAAPVRRLAVSAARGVLVTASDDKTARIWDLASRELRQILRPAVGAGETGRLYGAAIHPTEDLVAVAGSTGTSAGTHRILLFTLSGGVPVRQFDAHGGDIKDLAYSADGQLLLATYAGDNALRAFDRDGRMVFEQPLNGLSYGLDVAANGLVAVGSLAGELHVFETRGARLAPLRQWRGSGKVVSVAFSPDGERLAVGYYGSNKRSDAPEVFEARTGRSLLRADMPALAAGNLMSVGWRGDGRQLLAAGTGYEQIGAHRLYVFDARTGSAVGSHLLARDSVLDLRSIDADRVAYASFDGRWGIVDLARSDVQSSHAGLADLRGPGNLRLSADGARIGFSFDYGRTFSVFDIQKRVIRPTGSDGDLRETVFKRGFFGSPTWENTRDPQINGSRIAMRADEAGRSIAFLEGRDDALFGTSKALYYVNAQGSVRWRTDTAAEVRAINLTQDNTLAVTTMSDGTIRWWGVEDGQLRLSLLPRPDGQWVLWTPAGKFDASAGADRIVGWAVNRPDLAAADFFSLNRFRDPFNEPAAIDRLLGLASLLVPEDPAPVAEATPAPAPARPAVVPAPPPPALPAPSATAQPVRLPDSSTLDIRKLQFPPVLSAVDLSAIRRNKNEMQIPFGIRAEGRPSVEVRIDGRPAPEATVVLPDQFTGRERGIASVPTPPPGSVIQLIARDRNGISEPLGFTVPPPPPEQVSPVAPAAAVQSVPPVVSAVATPPTELAVASLRASPPTLAGNDQVLRGPRLFVLSIGISEYQKPAYQLGLAAKDSRDFLASVQRQKGRYYSSVATRSLTNGQASKTAILDSLQWLSSSVGPDDVGMLFIAGHGINAPDGQYYFLPFEGDHEKLAATAVPEQAIRTTLGQMRGRALFFVDTCYAGNALGNFRTASRELARLANNLAASENGVVVFASSSGRQLSEENDAWGNGAFTKAVIEGLDGGADLSRSGRITYKGLDYFISEAVSKLTGGRQTPVTISPIGVPDFAIARVASI